MRLKIKELFHKFAHAQGNNSSSKHERDALTYKHMARLLNSQPLYLQKVGKYYGSFIRHSAFSRKAYPGLDSVQREVLRHYQRHKMQQLYHPIEEAAIPSLGKIFNLVDLTTRKITIKC